jgi:hypothetical protein
MKKARASRVENDAVVLHTDRADFAEHSREPFEVGRRREHETLEELRFEGFNQCEGGDLNPHGSYPASTSS